MLLSVRYHPTQCSDSSIARFKFAGKPYSQFVGDIIVTRPSLRR
jgi:hypothetical protein